MGHGLRSALALLGRQARWALPVGVFAGIVLPDLAQLFRPLLTPAVIGTLTAALLRLNWSHIAAHVRAPGLLAVMCMLQLAVSPLLAILVASAAGLPFDLQLLLILQAAAPPIGSAAVFALIIGLNGALTAAVAFASTLLLPLTLTPLVAWLADASLRVDLTEFFIRVSLVVAAPFVIAGILRRSIGTARLARNDEVLSGLNVLLLVVFAIGVMDGVTARAIEQPRYIALLTGFAVLAAVVLHAFGYLALCWAGSGNALVAALATGNRNMGLMLAITGGTAGEAFSLYVGVAQIPMYFAPLVLIMLIRAAQRMRR